MNSQFVGKKNFVGMLDRLKDNKEVNEITKCNDNFI